GSAGRAARRGGAGGVDALRRVRRGRGVPFRGRPFSPGGGTDGARGRAPSGDAAGRGGVAGGADVGRGVWGAQPPRRGCVRALPGRLPDRAVARVERGGEPGGQGGGRTGGGRRRTPSGPALDAAGERAGAPSRPGSRPTRGGTGRIGRRLRRRGTRRRRAEARREASVAGDEGVRGARLRDGRARQEPALQRSHATLEDQVHARDEEE